MGFSLKKTLKKVGGGLSGFLFGKEGGSNPFSAPDLQALMKNNPYAGLTAKMKGSKDFLGDTLLSQDENDNAILQSLLTGVDADTKQAQGSLISDMAERGLVGPGVSSDIYSNAAAQGYADAAKTKSDARLGFAKDSLGRQFQAGMTDLGLYNDLLKTEAAGTSGRELQLAGLMSGQYNAGEANKKPRTPGFFDKWINSASNNFIKTSTEPETLLKLFGLGG